MEFAKTILRRPASFMISLLVLPLGLTFVGCTSLKSISILPASGSVVLTGIGQTAQFTAMATSQMGSANPTTSNITNSVTWSVSNPSVATINSSGFATATGVGHTEITAESGGVITESDLTVTISSGSGPSSGTPSILVSPGAVTETFTGETTQFSATGNLTGVGGVQNLTTQVQWVSSNVQVATINSSGIATAVGSGTTTIIRTAREGLSATATLTVALGATTLRHPPRP